MKSLFAVLLLSLAACETPAPRASQALVTEYKQPENLSAFVQALQRPALQNRVRVIYFYADWCGPCKRFRAALPSEPVDNALQHAALVKVNVDAYPEMMRYYGVNAVPTFVKVDAQGNALAKITSDKWGNDEPDEIALVMAKLVGSTAYDSK